MDNDKNPSASWHGARMDFSQAMSYGDYLALDQILSAQHPRSPNHNEMLFIVQHQTSELWLKLMLHELHAVRAQMHAGDLPPAFKMLAPAPGRAQRPAHGRPERAVPPRRSRSTFRVRAG